MTVEQKLKKMLFDCGMHEDRCGAVIELVKTETSKSMGKHWEDAADGYPDCLLSALWLVAKHYALEYIDENCPEAWFRPMFEPNGDLA